MIRLAMDSRGRAAFRRVLELSACWNSSKIFCWSAAAMPGPVSDTETVNHLGGRRLDRHLAASVNLIALRGGSAAPG